MKKRWFVVILTIGLLLSVLPLNALALSPDPITDLDGNNMGWEDLSTDLYSLDDLDDLPEQKPVVADVQPGTVAVPGPAETGPRKSLADADSDKAATDDPSVENPTPKLLDEESEDDDLADADRDKAAADDRNLTPKTPDEESGGDDPADADRDKAAADDRNLTPKTPDEESGGDDPADADSDKAAADDRNLTPKTSDEESDDDDPADDTGSTTAKAVCKIGKMTYSTLEEAINDASVGDRIDLLTDIEVDTGLEFRGKTLTISGGRFHTYTLTLKEYGIYAFESKLTFQDLTLNLYANKHTYENAGATANLISNSNLHLKRVDCTIRPEGDCGSGMFLYQKTNLYLDNSDVLVDTVNGKMVNGIYADNSEYSEDPALNREVILNNSHLKATGCSHSGLMLDPINMTLNSSEVEVTDNGEYGFSLYDGELTMENSTLKATNNDKTGGLFGIYVGSLNMDASSILEAYSNGGSGLGIGSPKGWKKSYIRGRVTCEYNGNLDTWQGGCGGGLYVYAEDSVHPVTHKRTIYKGDVTIESGATVSLCHNAGLSGIQNSWILKIASGARVSVDDNKNVGIYNSFDARLTIEGDAYVSASGNGEYGIENLPQGDIGCGFLLVQTGATVLANDNKDAGIINLHQNTLTVQEGVDLEVERNQNRGICNHNGAILKLGSGTVRYNHTTSAGGGLLNWGTAVLSDHVQLYNNHADIYGDDIYNISNCSLTFGPTGSGWELDGYPDCYDFIDGWYDDRSSARWCVHVDDEDARHTVLIEPGTELTGFLALKAAHGALSTGSLTVRKETIGELLPSDYDTAFTFELTLDDDTITTINDQWCGVPFQNGKASFTLKSGESITLSNLPAGIGYTIAEIAQDDWTLMNINRAETGVVPQNDTAEVVFTNLKNSPDNPDVPIIPIDPEEPEIPEEPEKPQTPEVPEEPEGPETPEETKGTEETETPAQDQTPGEQPAEEPAQADTFVSPAHPEETPAQGTTTVTLPQTGTTDWLAAVLLISGFGLLGCGWFFNRKQRAAKH